LKVISSRIKKCNIDVCFVHAFLFIKKVCSTGVFGLKFAKGLEYFKNEPEAEAFEKFIPLKILPFWPKSNKPAHAVFPMLITFSPEVMSVISS